jgi:uncharacterized protein (TIGR04141 family)
MPSFTCYSLHPEIDGRRVSDLDEFVDFETRSIAAHGPVTGPGFSAKLFMISTPPHEPRWADFIRSGFGSDLQVGRSASIGALLIVAIGDGEGTEHFAFAFGLTGRHLLKQGAWQRTYGLRTALNLIYPRGLVDEAELSRILAVDARRRGGQTLRSRRQSSRATIYEAFDLDKVRDVLNAATGRPADFLTWGRRISGGDALHFGADIEFGELGRLCERISQAHGLDDYRERFAWLDNIQPIADPGLRTQLEAIVIGGIRGENLDDFDLAPPEIIDWTLVESFRFSFDARRRVSRPELRLGGYLAGLRSEGELEHIDGPFLRRRTITALDADGQAVHRWSVWRCLVGEFQADDSTYVLDEGEFFAVAQDYMQDLNDSVAAVPESTLQLPDASVRLREREYNQAAVEGREDLLLLDRHNVITSASTTPVEICDILTRARQLVHVKRHLGARDLSHLFSQGFVSAELLQDDRRFREAAQRKIEELGGRGAFLFFDPEGIRTDRFEIIYAIVADWRGRTLVEALPFFSKVNLRRTAQDLSSRGFRVSCRPVSVSIP